MASIKLYFNSVEFPLYKDSYNLNILNKETERETEGGTIIRDIKRLGVPEITISQTIDQSWYQKIYNYYATNTPLTVSFFSPSTLAQATFTGYLKDLKYSPVVDNGTTYWKVSFKVKSY